MPDDMRQVYRWGKLYLVPTGNGLVIGHTLEEWSRLARNVDLKAARQHGAPLETNEQEETDE